MLLCNISIISYNSYTNDKPRIRYSVLMSSVDEIEDDFNTYMDESWEMPNFEDNTIKKAPMAKNAGAQSSQKKFIRVPAVNLNKKATNELKLAPAAPLGAKKKLPIKVDESDDFAFTDLDYEDFEEAMMEIEMGGLNPGSVNSVNDTTRF